MTRLGTFTVFATHDQGAGTPKLATPAPTP